MEINSVVESGQQISVREDCLMIQREPGRRGDFVVRGATQLAPRCPGVGGVTMIRGALGVLRERRENLLSFSSTFALLLG